VTVSACTTEDWRAIVEKAVKDARKGNPIARRWLSDILVGRDPMALQDILAELRAVLELHNANQ
jgi:hypothetical protein